MKLFRTLTAAGVIATAAIVPALAVDISGAGATFPYPIYAKWADAYKKETGAGLNYQSIGSGGGIKQIQAKTVTFGATDMPLKADELQKSGLVQFPTVLGGVVPVVNIDGIKQGDITLDGPTLAKIFMGEIKTWNDPAIAKLNTSAKLAGTTDRRRPPFRRVRHDVHLDRLPLEGEPGVEVQGRRQYRRRMAGRPRRQGQRGRGQQCRPDQGLHRLRRICLRQAEQAELRQDDQQGRQDRRPDLGGIPGGSRLRRLGPARRALA